MYVHGIMCQGVKCEILYSIFASLFTKEYKQNIVLLTVKKDTGR